MCRSPASGRIGRHLRIEINRNLLPIKIDRDAMLNFGFYCQRLCQPVCGCVFVVLTMSKTKTHIE